MKVERHNVQACCKQIAVLLKTSIPITNKMLDYFKSSNFNESEHFTKAGILYVNNENFIFTGPFGSTRLHVKCKVNNCLDKIDALQEFLGKFEG